MDHISNIIIWIVLLIISIATGIVILFQWKMRKYFRLLATFPSFPTLPMIGSVHLILGHVEIRMKKLLNIILGLAEPTVFWMSYTPIVFLNKSEDILKTLNRNQHRDILGMFENLLGDGIIMAKGEKWRHIRRIMNQAFTVPHLKRYMHVFNKRSIVLTKRLEAKANTGTSVDIWPYLLNSNYEVITENMMDYETMTRGVGEDEYMDAVFLAIDLECKRFYNPILYFNIFNKIYLYLNGCGKLYKKIYELPKKIFAEKLHERTIRKENGISGESKNLMDYLLEIHEQNPEFDEHKICSELVNMLLTGSDTTANTLSFVCLFLAMYPEIQDKVYEEIVQVFKDGFTEVHMEHCNQLKYTEQCIKEAIRRFSIVPIMFHQCSEPTKLNDEQVIPANCKVAFLYHAVHHNPAIYPEPEKYDPDRFSPEHHSQNANHFMGFGVGHRSCIGIKYAMLSMKTQMVHLLRKYRFTTDMQMSDVVHVIDIVSRSRDGYLVKLWHRQNTRQI